MTDGVPLLNPIAKRLERNPCILDKIGNNILAQPSAIRVLQHQGRIPVVQGNRRLDAILNTSIDQIVVMVDSQLVDRSAAKRQDAGPRQREAVDLNSLSSQAGDVFLVEIVVLPYVSKCFCSQLT